MSRTPERGGREFADVNLDRMLNVELKIQNSKFKIMKYMNLNLQDRLTVKYLINLLLINIHQIFNTTDIRSFTG